MSSAKSESGLLLSLQNKLKYPRKEPTMTYSPVKLSTVRSYEFKVLDLNTLFTQSH